MRTINTISGLDQQSVTDATHVERLIAEAPVPGENLAEVLQVVSRQLRTLEGEFADETRSILTRVKDQISRQVRDQTGLGFGKVFGFKGVLNTSNQDNDLPHSSSLAESA